MIIKSRGKRKDNGEWVCGSYLFDETNNRHYVGTMYFPKTEMANGCGGRRHGKETSKYQAIGLFEVNPETVGQFIGENDKNDKELYTGEIVLDIYGDKKVIVWDGDQFSFCLHNIEFWGHKNYSPYPMGEVVFLDQLESIGNIYDNSEYIRQAVIERNKKVLKKKRGVAQ